MAIGYVRMGEEERARQLLGEVFVHQPSFLRVLERSATADPDLRPLLAATRP